MAGTFLADPVAAWLTICLCSDRLEDFLDVRPCIWMPTRHQGRAVTSALLTAGNTGSNEEITNLVNQSRLIPLISKILASTIRVGEMRVSSIDDDVAYITSCNERCDTLFKMRQQCFDKVVYGGTGFDEKHYSAGTFEKGTQFLDRMSSND
jgi:hypothetical protein